MKIKLTDIDAALRETPPLTGNADKVLTVKSDGTGIEWRVVTGAGGGSADYPSFVGHAGDVLAVNQTEDGVAWFDTSVLQGPQGVKGDKGDRGDQGLPGRNVTTISINPEGHLIVNYSDNTNNDAGVIADYGVPPGGADGQYLVKISNSDRDTAWVDSPFGGMDSPYRFGGFFTTTPVADEVVMMHVAVDPFNLGNNMVGARAKIGTPPSSEVTLLVQNNGNTFGSMVIQPGGSISFYTLNDVTSIAAGDLITVVAPSNSQGMARMAFTFRSI